MNDIDIAKNKLIDDDMTLVIVKAGKIIYNSKDRGVLPVYRAATDDKYDTEGAAVADRVTGKGAALLCALAKIKTLHTGLVSRPALNVLEAHGIVVTYDTLVDYIKNRAGDGRCPVEMMSEDIINPRDVVAPVKAFLIRIGLM